MGMDLQKVIEQFEDFLAPKLDLSSVIKSPPKSEEWPREVGSRCAGRGPFKPGGPQAVRRSSMSPRVRANRSPTTYIRGRSSGEGSGLCQRTSAQTRRLR